MLTTLAIAGYRSLRDLVVPLQALNLVTGPNGSGKSNLYRALAAARRHRARARDRVAGARRRAAIDAVGGAGGVLASDAARRAAGAGNARRKPVSLRLGFAGDEFSYAIDLGLPAPPSGLSAATRRSSASASGTASRCASVERAGRSARPAGQGARGAGGLGHPHHPGCRAFDSMMTHCADPRHTPEMSDAARRHAGLALLRSLPDRRARSGPPAADRHPHPGAQPRRRRPRRRAPDHPLHRRRRGA